MTGFEYSFAGLLISEGFIEEGLQAVRAIRSRYDGEKRNPWNEIECGSNYARPMASFALLPIFSGFEFDLPHRHVGFAPIVPGDFRCLWSLGTGWGDYIKTENVRSIVIRQGSLPVESVSLDENACVARVIADGEAIPFTQKGRTVSFDARNISGELRFEVTDA